MSQATQFIAWILEDLNSLTAEADTPRDALLKEFEEQGFLQRYDSMHGNNYYAITSKGASEWLTEPAQAPQEPMPALNFDWAEGDPGTCARCGATYEMVRPGKSQPTCDCHTKCWAHDPPVPLDYRTTGNVQGHLCPVCQPVDA